MRQHESPCTADSFDAIQPMNHSFNRRTATKIKNGSVQSKSRRLPTTRRGYVLDRRPPGEGFRHVVTKREVQAFIELIPEWASLSQGLERVVLAPGGRANGQYAFYHREETSAIFLHAWEEELWVKWDYGYVQEHEPVLTRLKVPCEAGADVVICRFTEAQARAFMLLHVFMHELGHHHHRLKRPKHRSTALDENYAERFANARLDSLLPAYERVFGQVTR